MTRDQALIYIQWLSKKTGKPYRLLSEAEWEYAARAGTTGMRYWGDNPDDACQYANVYDVNGQRELKQGSDGFKCDDGYAYTAPVGSFKPNAFGLYDMLGNVLSMTADCFHDTYDGAPTDGSAWMEPGCTRFGRRGGSFHSLQFDLRVAKRGNGVRPPSAATGAPPAAAAPRKSCRGVGGQLPGLPRGALPLVETQLWNPRRDFESVKNALAAML